MTFGFPAYARGSRRYDSSPDDLKEAIARALSALGWTAYGNWPGRRFVAEVGANFRSWRERISVEIRRGGTVRVESTCRLPTQCFDWGKNQRNVDAFLDLVGEKCRQIGRADERPKGPAAGSDPELAEQGTPDRASEVGIRAAPSPPPDRPRD
jgi:hypothetical protein